MGVGALRQIWRRRFVSMERINLLVSDLVRAKLEWYIFVRRKDKSIDILKTGVKAGYDEVVLATAGNPTVVFRPDQSIDNAFDV